MSCFITSPDNYYTPLVACFGKKATYCCTLSFLRTLPVHLRPVFVRLWQCKRVCICLFFQGDTDLILTGRLCALPLCELLRLLPDTHAPFRLLSALVLAARLRSPGISEWMRTLANRTPRTRDEAPGFHQLCRDSRIYPSNLVPRATYHVYQYFRQNQV